MRSERFYIIRDVFLAALASLMMVVGYSGWLLQSAHPLPIVTLPSYKPMCNFQYPYGFAKHRMTINWEPTPL